MKTKTIVISALGTFESNVVDRTEKEIEVIRNLYQKSYALNWLTFTQGEKEIFFPADIIQKSIIILEVMQ